MKENTILTLSNGIRVVHRFIPTTAIVHCGIMINAGSRDETLRNQGIAHFWEHMAFKGTRRRTALQILHELDSVGGELNAYTDKEKIAFFASVRNAYTERAIDVLTDITFRSVFPEKELIKEKGVILEEMSMYLDSPDDSLQDEFEAMLYPKHPIGMNILGREATVRNFTRKDFVDFFSKHVRAGEVVFSIVGNVPEAALQTYIKRYLEPIKLPHSRVTRKKPNLIKPTSKEIFRNVKQAKCALGSQGVSLKHPMRIPLYLLANLLGGPGMNSRLNLNLRERYGYVYAIDAHSMPMTDTGMFAIFFGTDPGQLDKCLRLIRTELDRLIDKPLNRSQLNGLKEQIKGQLAMAEENNLNQMLMMARTTLDFGRVPNLDYVFDRIDAVSATTLQEVADKVFPEKRMSILKMLPSKDK